MNRQTTPSALTSTAERSGSSRFVIDVHKRVKSLAGSSLVTMQFCLILEVEQLCKTHKQIVYVDSARDTSSVYAKGELGLCSLMLLNSHLTTEHLLPCASVNFVSHQLSC